MIDDRAFGGAADRFGGVDRNPRALLVVALRPRLYRVERLAYKRTDYDLAAERIRKLYYLARLIDGIRLDALRDKRACRVTGILLDQRGRDAQLPRLGDCRAAGIIREIGDDDLFAQRNHERDLTAAADRLLRLGALRYDGARRYIFVVLFVDNQRKAFLVRKRLAFGQRHRLEVGNRHLQRSFVLRPLGNDDVYGRIAPHRIARNRFVVDRIADNAVQRHRIAELGGFAYLCHEVFFLPLLHLRKRHRFEIGQFYRYGEIVAFGYADLYEAAFFDARSRRDILREHQALVVLVVKFLGDLQLHVVVACPHFCVGERPVFQVDHLGALVQQQHEHDDDHDQRGCARRDADDELL